MLYNTLFSCRMKLSKDLKSRNFLYDDIEEGTDVVDDDNDFTEADLLDTNAPTRKDKSSTNDVEDADLIVKSVPP